MKAINLDFTNSSFMGELKLNSSKISEKLDFSKCNFYFSKPLGKKLDCKSIIFKDSKILSTQNIEKLSE